MSVAHGAQHGARQLERLGEGKGCVPGILMNSAILGLFRGPPSDSRHKTMPYLLQRLWQGEDVAAGHIYIKGKTAVWPCLSKCAPQSFTLPGGLWHLFNRWNLCYLGILRVLSSKPAFYFQTAWECAVLVYWAPDTVLALWSESL